MNNPFEAASRETKTRGLILALERFSAYRGSPVTAMDVLGWTETSWELLAMIADVTVPSVITRSVVLKRLADRDAAVLAANEAARGRVVES